MDKKNWFWAILSGLLLTCAFPKFGLWLAGWFALVPLLMAIKNLSFGEAFRIGFASGLAHFLSLLYWLTYTMQIYGGLPFYLAIPVLFLLSAYMALYIGLFAGFTTWYTRSFSWQSFAAVPVFWVFSEYVRGFLFSGFPWAFLGYSQYNQLHLIQISDIFGVYGVSFLMALANTALFWFLKIKLEKKQSKNPVIPFKAVQPVVVFLIFLAAAWSYGKWQVLSFEDKLSKSDIRRVTVVQGNIDQAIKWDPAFQSETTKKYINLSISAEKHKPDLIVWPETATPFYFLFETPLSKMVLDTIIRMGTDFLIGSPSFSVDEGSENVKYYNSAYLIGSETGVLGKYDKVHLVPFGEYVPFKKWLPFLGKMVDHVGDFKSGKQGDTLEWQDQKLGLQICFEIIFPELSRAMAKNGADILVNITNDAWFGKTSAPYQHFSMAVFRAVENRRTLVRSANTGISGFVDPTGKVLAQSSLFEDAVLTQSIPIYRGKSFYTRYGDVFAIACSILTILFALMGLYSRKTDHKSKPRLSHK